LADYDIRWEYQPGKDNNADPLEPMSTVALCHYPSSRCIWVNIDLARAPSYC
jgi:hypothetical protein